MVCNKIIFLALIASTHCLPFPTNRRKDNIKLPNLNFSPPEEVNSLDLEVQESRRALYTNQPSKNDNNNNQNNIEATIKEVEDILRANPKLPRLTRGEILDLIENITEVDTKSSNINKDRDPKAIMVVMPFTPTKTDDKSMEDLYTKAPITQIIGAEPFRPATTENYRRRRPITEDNNSPSTVEPSTTTTRNHHRRRRPPTTPLTTTTTTEMSPTTYHPPSPSTTRSRRPVRRRTTTTTTQHPNHKYPEVDPMKIVPSPDLNIEENVRDEVVFNNHNYFNPYSTRRTPPSDSLVTTTTSNSKPIADELNIPDNLRGLVKDLNLDVAYNEPTKSTVDTKKPTPSKTDEQKRIETMLESIGVFPVRTTTTTTAPSAESVADNLSPEMKDLLVSFGLLPTPPNTAKMVNDGGRYNPEKAEVKPESYVGFKPLPDDGPGRDDMDALLASFGLGRSGRRSQKSMLNQSNKTNKGGNFEVVPDNFRGLMKDLGLDQVNIRQEKKISDSSKNKNAQKITDDQKEHVFNPDEQYASPDELKKLEKLLEMVRTLEKLNGTATEEDLKKIDINGLKDLIGSLNQAQSLQEDTGPDPTVLDTIDLIIKNEIKRQQSTTTTAASSTTTEESKDAPEAFSGQAITSTSPAMEESNIAPVVALEASIGGQAFTSTSPTTEESKNAALADLEASFGGQADAMTEVTTVPPPETTTRKRTGFYYLVDWNTFLDIDDTKGKRVNLRFQPKIGDPKRFLSVTVP